MGTAADSIADFAAGDRIFLKTTFGGTFVYTPGGNFASGADITSAGTDLPNMAGEIAFNTSDGRVFISGFGEGTVPVVVLQPGASVSFSDFSFF